MNIFKVLIPILILTGSAAFAQSSNGKVSSLVAAENYFAARVKEKGIREAFLKVSDEESLIFRPLPVKIVDYFENKQDKPVSLIWEPIFAKISKSGDWGFTTGPSVYTDSSTVVFGQYLSVWKTNKRGVWKLALDIGISHPEPMHTPELDFRDPQNTRYQTNNSVSRTKQRIDMIVTTDRLYSTTRLMKPEIAFNDYFTPDSRILFPGYEPLIGKDQIAAFFKKKGLNVHTEISGADRALGSDFAYTYGTATISTSDSKKEYSYVRIWENLNGKWNVIVEAFTN